MNVKTLKQIIVEARQSREHAIEGHPYHSKTDDQLRYIIKDAGEAAKAMRTHGTPQGDAAESKYLDQVNDASTVLGFRKRHGMPDWYKAKYFPKSKVDEELQNPRTSEVKSKCWKGYTAIGMKRKKGKWVPNCVPSESVEHDESNSIEEVLDTPEAKSSYVMKASDKNVKNAVDLVKKGKNMSNNEFSNANQKIKNRDKVVRKVLSKLNKNNA